VSANAVFPFVQGCLAKYNNSLVFSAILSLRVRPDLPKSVPNCNTDCNTGDLRGHMASGKLTARAMATAKAGTHGDGGGLHLVVTPAGGRKWVYRFSWRGKVKMMGLGSADVVGLSEARGLRDEARRVLASGINPIEARRAEDKVIPTFGALADELLEAKRLEWRNAKHAEQWGLSITKFAEPLRAKAVDEIDTAAVLGVLTPLWQRAPETASRLRGRIEAVLNAAKARGFRSGENPAAWGGAFGAFASEAAKARQASLPRYAVCRRAGANPAAAR
jgi:hypothetical protein